MNKQQYIENVNAAKQHEFNYYVLSKTKNQVIDQMNAANEKQQTIQYLTDLMATIHAAYFKGRLEGRQPRVHERMDDSTAISIDLYHFEGDGLPVCDGLKPCTVSFDDGSQEVGDVFCMCYDPDDVTPLTFLMSFDIDESTRDSHDIGIGPDSLPTATLQNIIKWLEEQVKPGKQEAKQESDFLRAVNDLQNVSMEALERLHTAAHEVIAELQGDMRLPEAAARYPIISPILTTELTAFKAYAVKYTKQNQNKQ